MLPYRYLSLRFSCYQAELLLNRKTKLSNKRNWSFIFSEWVIVSIKYNTYMYTIGSWTKSQRNMCSSLCLLTPHISTEEITSNKSSWQWSVLFRICQILFLYRETLLLHYFQSNKQTRRQALPFQNRKLKPSPWLNTSWGKRKMYFLWFRWIDRKSLWLLPHYYTQNTKKESESILHQQVVMLVPMWQELSCQQRILTVLLNSSSSAVTLS